MKGCALRKFCGNSTPLAAALGIDPIWLGSWLFQAGVVVKSKEIKRKDEISLITLPMSGGLAVYFPLAPEGRC